MKILFSGGEELPAIKGRSILEALKEGGVFLTASCGGKGACGKCRIKLLEGDAGIRGTGKLTEKERRGGFMLACQCFPEGDVTIEIPESSKLVVGEKIALSRAPDLLGLVSSLGFGVNPAVREETLTLRPPALEDKASDLERLKKALREAGVGEMRFSASFLAGLGMALREADWKIAFRHIGPEALAAYPQETRRAHYGFAIDLGTTTVVLYLVNLEDGMLVDAGSTYNSQIRHGDDVITRIVYATEGGGLGSLRKLVREDVNDLAGAMAKRHGVKPEEVELAVVSGNTTMSHLFWGLNPGSIREEPYVPGVSFYPRLKGSEAGIGMNPAGAVYTLPSVASYVGGDIVAGILASKMHRSSETALFMDIGTNGEIAVGNNEWLITAACSAGPCFEGSGIRHGMRATEGAIESVIITPGFDIETGVIGANGLKGGHPRGICGSGMIDALSEMFLKGVIDRKGNFRGELDYGQNAWRLRQGEEGMEFVLARSPQGDITLAEADMENLMRAKAAIYAGLSTLIKEVGLRLEDIKRLYIAGGFGNYLDIEKAIIIGMLPDVPRERFVFLGNASITGAYLCLVSEDLRKEAEAIASRMTYMELSVSGGFMSEYLSALFLPHTDITQFPTVKRLLGE